MRFVQARTVWLAVLLAMTLIASGQVAAALGTSKALRQYGRQSWESDSGLPQNTVHAVLQTRSGFIWIATEGGLVRFDGQEFRTFNSSNTPQFSSDVINALAEDMTENGAENKTGVLWVGTSSGLLRLDGEAWKRFTTADGLPSDDVRLLRMGQGGGLLVVTAAGVAVKQRTGFQAIPEVKEEIRTEQIAEDASGRVFLASGQRVISIAKGAVTANESFQVTEIGDLQAIASDPSGEIWVGGRGGLALYRAGKRVPLSLSGEMRAQTASGSGNALNVSGLVATPDGEAWVGTATGLYKFRQGGLKLVSGEAGNGPGRVNQMYLDREGTLWAAFDLEVMRLLPGAGNNSSRIDVAGVLSIFEDSEGDMWFGTDVGGATVLREQVFTMLTTQDGLSDDFVRAVFEDHAGTVWLGTSRGGLNELAGGRISSLRAGGANRGGTKPEKRLSSNVVLALAESGGYLWVGTPDGLSRLESGSGELKLFTTADGLPDDFVRSLYADPNGSLWIGTRNGLSHYSRGTFTSYSALDGLGSDLVGSILKTRDGVLWVGTLNGLSRLEGRQFRSFARKDGLGGDAITALAEDSTGTLWIAAHASGLTRYRNGVFSALSPAQAGLPVEIYSILQAERAGAAREGSRTNKSESDLWLGSSKGIFRVPLTELNAFADKRTDHIEVQSFGVADGLRISECSSGGHPAAWRMRDGSLWFATLRGAAEVHPGDLLGAVPAPLTAIEDVSVGEKNINGTEPLMQALVLPPGSDRITIHYAGLSFAAPDKVRFRYKLEGLDRDFIQAGPRRTAYYTNVPPGSYRFMVYASTSDGLWSAVPSELKLTVRPHFYQTLWFYLLSGVMVLCLAYLAYQTRVRTVEAQYNAVLAERNRIAREIHDTLAQGYVGVSVQLEVISRMLRKAELREMGEAAAKQLEKTKELVRSSLAEARSSIWNLRSPGKESETLPARLSAVVENRRQSGEGGPAIHLKIHGSFRPLERRIEDEVLRIAQEAISNVFRHAAATEVDVLLSYDTDWLRLAVQDNGQGFEPSTRESVLSAHYGLRGMKERADGIAADLIIRSRPGSGTAVELGVELRSGLQPRSGDMSGRI